MNKNRQNSEIFAFVPSYNHAPFIETCLKSIINQTVPPAKLLVIDDGSSDGSPRIIERILKDCLFDTELIVRENRGLCATLNEAFALSKGKYFAYIGADDYWQPFFFEERVKLLEKSESAVLGYGHAFIIDEEGQIFDSTANHADEWSYSTDGDARDMLLRLVVPISSTVFYRRSALETVAWNENSPLEDYEMYLKLAQLGNFAFDPQELSAWRRHSYNTSHNIDMMLKEVIAAQNRNFGNMGVGEVQSKKIQEQIKFYYARIFLQEGEKQQAFQLARKNWHGSRSGAQLVKFVLRMFVPMFVVKFWRNRKK